MPRISKSILVVAVVLSCNIMALLSSQCSAKQTNYYLSDQSAGTVPIVQAIESPTVKELGFDS